MKNGTLWLDTDGRGIQAHGGCILQYNDTFYWYGENKDIDTHNRSVDFVGFSCYKSRDLFHWARSEPSQRLRAPQCFV